MAGTPLEFLLRFLKDGNAYDLNIRQLLEGYALDVWKTNSSATIPVPDQTVSANTESSIFTLSVLELTRISGFQIIGSCDAVCSLFLNSERVGVTRLSYFKREPFFLLPAPFQLNPSEVIELKVKNESTIPGLFGAIIYKEL